MQRISGTLDRLNLGDLLEWLHLTRATGRLLLAAGATTRSFDIVRGKVSFASSSRASERLASWLLRRDLAPRRVLLAALAISQTRGEIFTEVVERQFGVSHETLIEAGRSLATALASRLLREEVISFHFDPSWPVTDRFHVTLDLECSKLIMQAAYRADTVPPADQQPAPPLSTLDPEAIENLFWHIIDDMEEEPVEAGAVVRAHRTLRQVGDVMHRWVSQGPPLLPIPETEVARARARLASGSPPLLEDSPTLAWDILALVNGLDAPGMSRASGAAEAWQLAGEDGPLLASLLLDNPRWHRPVRSMDATLRRAALARAAAARHLAPVLGLGADSGATAVALGIVLLDLVLVTLASAPLASVSMQGAALRRLLPLLGQAAAAAAGFPLAIAAALTGDPFSHPGARLARLTAAITGDLGGAFPAEPLPEETQEPSLAAALAAAHRAASMAGDEG
ncbi:MAG: DUF4388 domain-containing protein [Acidobacteriota bacterium]|jgi:hypothetical protein